MRSQIRAIIDSEIVEPVEFQDASKRKMKKKRIRVVCVAKKNKAMGDESLRFPACVCGKYEDLDLKFDKEQR